MVAANRSSKKSSEKFNTEMFADVPVLKRTAEGVETMEQLDWLRAEGCNEVRGFLFSAAKPAAEVAELLARFGARVSQAA
jgi:sensor c-di-GMP phosphodiesterase-like protein